MAAWRDLVRMEPRLQQWERDARSIARHAERNWYPLWIRSYAGFRRDLDAVCSRHNLDARQVIPAAAEALIDLYVIERRRLAKGKRGPSR
jgi:hypothetical protein